MPSQPEPVPLSSAASIDAAREYAMKELRELAVQIASGRGHQLGTWRDVHADDAQVAYCHNCWRSAIVEVTRDPHHLVGAALYEVCPNGGAR